MKASLLKLLLFVVMLATAALVARAFGLKVEELSVEKVQRWIEGFGALAPVIFVMVYALGPLLLFPGSVLTIVGGLAFGWLSGFLYVVIGANLAANASFGIARLFGRDFVARVMKGKAEKVQSFVEREGFYAILLMRLVPIVPFNVLNYTAGLAPIRWVNYAGATLLGMLPGIFVYVFLGGNLDYRRPAFWGAVAMLATLSLVPMVYRRLKRGNDPLET